MSGIMPHSPESVTYDEYERLRDEGLPPTSVYECRPYTARFKAAQHIASRQEYAYDMLTIILKIQHLGRYSIIGARIRDIEGFFRVEFGINQNGIAFDHNPLPEDLSDIPYKAELGYFVGESDVLSGGVASSDISEQIRSPEELLAASR